VVPSAVRAAAPAACFGFQTEDSIMKTIQQYTSVAGAVLALAFGGCADMNHQQKSTAVGAGAGAVGGAVLSGGSVLGTAAGAVVGGVIGNEVGKK
jgi:osmotically inducible lipoprotein OsmB